jgi:hypothetical protein
MRISVTETKEKDRKRGRALREILNLPPAKTAGRGKSASTAISRTRSYATRSTHRDPKASEAEWPTP